MTVYNMVDDPKYSTISPERKREIELLATRPATESAIEFVSDAEKLYADEVRTMAEIANGIVPISESPAVWMPRTAGDFERIAERIGMWELEAKALKERAKALTEEYQRHATALRSRYYVAFKQFFETEHARLKLKTKSLKILTAQLGTQAKGGNVVFSTPEECQSDAMEWIGELIKELALMSGEDEVTDMPADLKWLLRHHSAENKCINLSVGYLVSGLKEYVKAIPMSVSGDDIAEHVVVDKETGETLEWLGFAPAVEEFYIRPFQAKEGTSK